MGNDLYIVKGRYHQTQLATCNSFYYSPSDFGHTQHAALHAHNRSHCSCWHGNSANHLQVWAIAGLNRWRFNFYPVSAYPSSFQIWPTIAKFGVGSMASLMVKGHAKQSCNLRAKGFCQLLLFSGKRHAQGVKSLNSPCQ